MSLNAAASRPTSSPPTVARRVEAPGETSRVKATNASSGAVTRRATTWLTITITRTLTVAAIRMVRVRARDAAIRSDDCAITATTVSGRVVKSVYATKHGAAQATERTNTRPGDLNASSAAAAVATARTSAGSARSSSV